MKKKYLSLVILPLLVLGVSSCDSIVIMDSRDDINPTDPDKTSEEDPNSYSIEVVSYPETIEVGKSSPVTINLTTETEEETIIEEGTNANLVLISSDSSTLSVSKTSVVGVKVGTADLTVRWVSHPDASVTIEGIEVVIGYTYDISLSYYITPEEEDEEADDDEDDDEDQGGTNEPEEASSITLDIEDALTLSDFTIRLGTLEDDGETQNYTQVVFTDEEYQGNDTVKFISTDEEVLKVSEDGDSVTALSSGRAYLSVTWVDHDVSSSTIRINVNAAPEPDPENPDDDDPDADNSDGSNPDGGNDGNQGGSNPGDNPDGNGSQGDGD